MDNLAIRVEDVCKVYKLYDKPSDRLKDALGLVRKNRFKEHHALNHVSFEVKKVRRSALSEPMDPEIYNPEDYYRSADSYNGKCSGKRSDFRTSGAGCRIQYGLYRN